jgi:hypothetical protein
MHKISIPKPCFENWGNMTPDGLGRYCGSCNRTVVDFTIMNDEQVQRYFIDNYGKQICGHFKNVQLQRITIELPQNILQIQLPFWKKFLVLLLLCYGGSFLGIDTSLANNNAFSQGKPITVQTQFYNQIKAKAHKRTKRQYKKPKVAKLEFINVVMGAFTPIDIEMCRTTGFTVTKPDKPAISINSMYPAPGNNAINDTNHSQNIASADNTSKKQPEKPVTPFPVKTEFLLPASITQRRSLFSKKKK